MSGIKLSQRLLKFIPHIFFNFRTTKWKRLLFKIKFIMKIFKWYLYLLKLTDDDDFLDSLVKCLTKQKLVNNHFYWIIFFYCFFFPKIKGRTSITFKKVIFYVLRGHQHTTWYDDDDNEIYFFYLAAPDLPYVILWLPCYNNMANSNFYTFYTLTFLTK